MSLAFAAFGLTSPVTQTAAPFTIGHTFKKGEVPSNYYVTPDLANVVVVPLRTWNDGSLKTAMITGRAPLTANVKLQVNLLKTLTAPVAGTLLTAADIQAAAPTASVTCGAFGSVSLTSLLTTPQRTYISTKEMVECHYKAMVGADTNLYAIFHVRLYLDGRMRVRVIVGNGFLGGSRVNKTYAATVVIGGATVFSAATYYHWPWARWDQIGWIGTDSQVTPQHDVGYLSRTKLVPNYWKNANNTNALSYCATIGSYVPGANLGFSASMGNGGYQDDIGILPRWEAIYCASGGHPTAYAAVIAGGRAVNSYPISYPDATSFNPIKITDYPTWSVYGAGQGGSYGEAAIAQDGTTALAWEKAHSTSAGYLAALLTGDYYFIETCQHQARLIYLCEDINGGNGVDRYIRGQNRARGWGYRGIGQAAAIYPDSMVAQFGDVSSWIAGFTARNVTYYTTTPSYLGYEDLYNNRLAPNPAPDGQVCAGTAPWEHHFTTMSYAHLADLEPVGSASMANVTAYSAYLEGAPIWITGGNSINEYHFSLASAYDVNIRMSAPVGTYYDIQVAQLIATGGQIFTDTYSTSSATLVYNPGTNTLGGTSAGDPGLADGYWGNLLPALAAAVDHGKAGAAASWARITGATNFASQQNAPYDYEAVQMGIVPRSYSLQPMTFTPIGSNADPEPGAQMAGIGATTRVDSGNWIAGATVVGTRGLGVLAQNVPGTGTNGASVLYNDVAFPADTDKEVRALLVTPPASGTLFLYEDGSFSYVPVGSGSNSFVYKFLKEGVDMGNATVTLNVGTTDTTLPVMAGVLSSSAITASGYTLSWSAASDNVAVTGYEVSIDNGSTYTNVGNVLTVTESSLAASTLYNNKVRAYDAANNKALPLSLAVTTAAAAGAISGTLSAVLRPATMSATATVAAVAVSTGTLSVTLLPTTLTSRTRTIMLTTPADRTYVVDDPITDNTNGKFIRVKDPDATLDYFFSWGTYLTKISDTILLAEVLVSSGAVAEITFTATGVTAWVSGGLRDDTIEVLCRITTTAGRVDDRTIYLKIKDM